MTATAEPAAGGPERAPETAAGGEEPGPAEFYLDLLKRVLTRSGFESSFRLIPAGPTLRHLPRRAVQKTLARRGMSLVMPVDPALRTEGKDWPSDAETMLGTARLDNVEECVRDVVRAGVPGDLIETGVWRGGTTILMRAVLKAYGVTDRVVWVADSFQGLPRPDAARYSHDAGDPFWGYDALAVTVEQVKANFARYGLLDDQVRFLPGWFSDTLHTAPVERLAVLRLDGDMYEATMVALRALFPKVSPGGYVIVDDYGAVPGCKAATDDYRAANGITAPLQEVDWTAVFWRKAD